MKWNKINKNNKEGKTYVSPKHNTHMNLIWLRCGCLFPISPSGSRPWIKAASAFTVSWLSIHYWCHLQFLVQFSVLKSIRHWTFLDRQWTLIAFNWQGVIHRKPWTPQFDTLWKENASVVNLHFNRQMSDIRYHSCICQKLELLIHQTPGLNIMSYVTKK